MTTRSHHHLKENIIMAKKPDKPMPTGSCRECKYCSDFYSKSYQNEYVLGECSVKKLSVLLSDWCKEFEKRR